MIDETKPASDAPAEPMLSARSGWRAMLSLQHAHSARSAALLLGASSVLSGLMGLVRTKYIAFVFGASAQTDAYQGAFELPDMINYFLVGGVASITLVSMLSRFRKHEDEAGESLAISIVLNAMFVVLGLGVLIGEVVAPLYVRYKFPAFTADQAALCTSLTRIVLPAQICFFAGGVLGSRLLVRKIFLYQAITPLIYNLGIILGGVLLARVCGIYSLAWGVLAGVFVGPFLLNAIGAKQTGLRWQPVLSLRHPLFREWLRLSLPLMIGVSLVTADKWILTYFASADRGGITRLNMAKTLFNAPMGVLGQAAGAASLPFFAALFAKGDTAAFSRSVDRSVSRVISVSLLLGAWLVGAAQPLTTLLFRGGSFHQADAAETALYFAIFTLSLWLWAAQGIYARAFYAAGNTMTPAIAGTLVTVFSIPLYAVLFHRSGMLGLTIASDLGITAQVLVLAVLLHTNRLVSLAELDWAELAKTLVASVAGFFAVRGVLMLIGMHAGRGLAAAALRLILTGAVWAAISVVALLLMRSSLPSELRRRRS